MISPVVDSVLDSFLFGWLWIQFVSHHEVAILYVQGYEVILENRNKAGYQKAWLRSRKFQWFLMYLVLSASGASRAKQETSTVRPHAWEADDGRLLLAVRDAVVPSTQDKIIHASQRLDLFYHNQIWGPHMESLLTFLPSHPIGPFSPSALMSPALDSRGPPGPPDHLPQLSQNSLLQWPVSMLTFFVPTQLRLFSEAARHCLPLPFLTVSCWQVTFCPCRFSLPGLFVRCPCGIPFQRHLLLVHWVPKEHLF